MLRSSNLYLTSRAPQSVFPMKRGEKYWLLSKPKQYLLTIQQALSNTFWLNNNAWQAFLAI